MEQQSSESSCTSETTFEMALFVNVVTFSYARLWQLEKDTSCNGFTTSVSTFRNVSKAPVFATSSFSSEYRRSPRPNRNIYSPDAVPNPLKVTRCHTQLVDHLMVTLHVGSHRYEAQRSSKLLVETEEELRKNEDGLQLRCLLLFEVVALTAFAAHGDGHGWKLAAYNALSGTNYKFSCAEVEADSESRIGRAQQDLVISYPSS
ncbi:hypothetical protein R1sor_008485 [Riccia sorocarpa]|uniref:Uncharacterized protein n=1 Tax=Riccia sorocarpa TaxID=122646 RepID=A0ABD3HZT4_9MARC